MAAVIRFVGTDRGGARDLEEHWSAALQAPVRRECRGTR
jgi:hypothetical protein